MDLSVFCCLTRLEHVAIGHNISGCHRSFAGSWSLEGPATWCHCLSGLSQLELVGKPTGRPDTWRPYAAPHAAGPFLPATGGLARCHAPVTCDLAHPPSRIGVCVWTVSSRHGPPDLLNDTAATSPPQPSLDGRCRPGVCCYQVPRHAIAITAATSAASSKSFKECV